MTGTLRQVGAAVLLVWVVATVCFLSLHLVPGDPAALLLSAGGMPAEPEQIEQLREELGLNRPLTTQYIEMMGRLATGDLGRSIRDGSSISEEIGERLPRTLELVFSGTLIATLMGLFAGTYAAVRPLGAFDRAASLVSAFLLSTPGFVFGTVMVLVFAQWLRWVPAGGYVPIAESLPRHLALLALPALTIGLGLAPVVFRMTRASVLDVALRDYVRTARAKGVRRGRILMRHILRTALLPVVTVLALHFGTLLGGTVLTEYVFNYPGLSGMLIDAVQSRDYPEVQAIVLVISTIFVAINLAVELLYAALDPRVRIA